LECLQRRSTGGTRPGRVGGEEVGGAPPPPGPWVYILLLTQPQKKYFASFYGKPSK
jgi:hypothetical protein